MTPLLRRLQLGDEEALGFGRALGVERDLHLPAELIAEVGRDGAAEIVGPGLRVLPGRRQCDHACTTSLYHQEAGKRLETLSFLESQRLSRRLATPTGFEPVLPP